MPGDGLVADVAIQVRSIRALTASTDPKPHEMPNSKISASTVRSCALSEGIILQARRAEKNIATGTEHMTDNDI